MIFMKHKDKDKLKSSYTFPSSSSLVTMIITGIFSSHIICMKSSTVLLVGPGNISFYIVWQIQALLACKWLNLDSNVLCFHNRYKCIPITTSNFRTYVSKLKGHYELFKDRKA